VGGCATRQSPGARASSLRHKLLPRNVACCCCSQAYCTAAVARSTPPPFFAYRAPLFPGRFLSAGAAVPRRDVRPGPAAPGALRGAIARSRGVTYFHARQGHGRSVQGVAPTLLQLHRTCLAFGRIFSHRGLAHRTHLIGCVISVSPCVRQSIATSIQCDRLSHPLHSVDGQSQPWGVCIILASRREESHLYSLQEDLMGSPPHPWLRGHCEGTDRSDSLNVGYKEQISISMCYGATSGHNPRACGAVGERTGYA
jgi:hypothetical protein